MTRSMRPFTIVAAFCLAAMLLGTTSAEAQSPVGFGFQPFGFYQPYGIQYRSSVPTPPYFAVNPPVYYGTRYFRPYGLSPFAAPPQVSAPESYTGQIAPSNLRSRNWTGPVVNPFICNAETGPTAKPANPDFAVGEVQKNPFVSEATMLAGR